MDLDASFGSWLAQRRKALRLTRAELAARAGCAAVTLRKIEQDARRPSPELATKLAEHLGIAPDDRARFVQVARGERMVEWLPAPEPRERVTPLASGTQPASLPNPTTRLIGRQREVAAVSALLWSDAVRLVVLTGPGGVGKTRVSVQAAAVQRPAFPDGVVFVALAPLRDYALVIPTVAHALGLRETGVRTSHELLVDYLRPRNILLVLDNFEHVTAAAPAIAQLLSLAPRLKLLITSRSVLHLYGEHDVSIRPLALPDSGQLPLIEQLIATDAIQLFSERARAATADFVVTSHNAAVLAAICQRLDGLPLALELVAAWTRMLPPAAVLARLNRAHADSPLHFVGGGAGDRPDRQRSLYATIDWSYQLLDDAEQTLLQQLAVFVGGCTLVSAEAVLSEAGTLAVGGSSARATTPAGMLDRLASLVDKSLLMSSSSRGTQRFTMLETIHEYALERLEEAETFTLQRRHAAYCLHLLETTLPGTDWLDQVAVEYDNMRAALTWAIEQREEALAAALGQQLEWFWFARGHISEGRGWLERVLTMIAPTAETRPDLAVLGRMAGYFAYFQGDYIGASALFAASLTRFRELDDQIGVAKLLINQGMVAEAQGDAAQARVCFEESLALRQTDQNRYHLADSLYHLGRLTLFEGDHARANDLLEESLALFRTFGISGDYMVPIVLGFLGYACLEDGAAGPAATCFCEALVRLQEQGNMFMAPYNLFGLAGALGAQGQAIYAVSLIGTAETLTTQVGLRPSPNERVIWDGIIAAVHSQLSEAEYQAGWSAGRAMSLDQAIAASLRWGADATAGPTRR